MQRRTNMHGLGLALLLVCSCVTCSDDREAQGSLLSDVAALRNDDVLWDGNHFGLWPQVSTDRAKRILAAGNAATPHLRRALRDPKKYVAAHVLLSQRSGRTFQLSASEYNGLAVTLFSDGRVEIPDQRAKIAELWVQSSTSQTTTQ